MKSSALLTTATLFAGSLLTAQADSKEEVKAAIAKLTEKANYSWTSTTKRPEGVEGRGGAGQPATGKTADGFVLLASTRGDRTFETLRKGEKMAVKRDDAWSVIEPRPAGEGNQGGQEGRRGRNFGRGGGREFTAPAAQAAELLEKVAELTKDGDTYTGALTEEGAKSLLALGGGGRRGGGEQEGDRPARPEPTGVKATATFVIKDGALAKYESSVSGSITVNENERDLSRVTTVEITEVGSTKIDVPEETKKQLGAE